MRKIIGFVLLGLGAALLSAAVVSVTWATGEAKKTPIDVDTTTYLEGTGARIGAEGLSEPRPVRVTNRSRVDAEESTGDVAVFVTTSCVVYTDEGDVPDCPEDDEDPSVFTIGVPDRFATDRETALAVDESPYIPEDVQVVQHEGIINKFPFDTERRTYDYWDGLTARTWPAEFVGVEDTAGLATYHFSVTIEDAPAEIARDTQGTYSNQIDIWVEPRTGSIVRQTQEQQRFLEGTGSEPGPQALDLEVAFTDETVERFVADAEDNIASLDLITKTIPLVGFIGGGLCLAAGAALLVLGRRRETDEVATHRESVPAGR